MLLQSHEGEYIFQILSTTVLFSSISSPCAQQTLPATHLFSPLVISREKKEDPVYKAGFTNPTGGSPGCRLDREGTGKGGEER